MSGIEKLALDAVLLELRAGGYDLDNLLERVKSGVISRPLRPNPRDQGAVIDAVAESIRLVRSEPLPKE